jgi:hypothetical protein
LYCKKNDRSIFIEKFCQFPLEIKNIVEVPQSIVYPNPNDGHFAIKINADAKVSIFDMYGQIVLSRQINKGIVNFDISDKSTGLYFVHVNSPIGNSALKVFKK